MPAQFCVHCLASYDMKSLGNWNEMYIILLSGIFHYLFHFLPEQYFISFLRFISFFPWKYFITSLRLISFLLWRYFIVCLDDISFLPWQYFISCQAHFILLLFVWFWWDQNTIHVTFYLPHFRYLLHNYFILWPQMQTNINIRGQSILSPGNSKYFLYIYNYWDEIDLIKNEIVMKKLQADNEIAH